jgi:hypothetical protein
MGGGGAILTYTIESISTPPPPELMRNRTGHALLAFLHKLVLGVRMKTQAIWHMMRIFLRWV